MKRTEPWIVGNEGIRPGGLAHGVCSILVWYRPPTPHQVIVADLDKGDLLAAPFPS